MDSFYGEPVCTPSRAALMTGRYPMRYGLQTLVIFPSHTYGLPTDERTLPQALKDVGYTTLMTGKWHLGHADRKYWPQNRGFDYFYGNVMGEVDYFTHDRGGVTDWQRNGTFLKEPGYPDIKDKNRRACAGMTSVLDDQVGRVVVELDKKHLRDNTLILFASDNGGATSGLFAQGAKSKKERDTEEGGIDQGAKAPASNAPLRWQGQPT
jgi:arylsulfatase A-like enzyme